MLAFQADKQISGRQRHLYDFSKMTNLKILKVNIFATLNPWFGMVTVQIAILKALIHIL